MTPSMSQLVRDIREPLYEVYTIAKALAMPLRIIFFGDVARSGVGATQPQITNLTKVGELVNPEEQEVYSVQVEFIEMLVADVLGICQNYVLQGFLNNQKIFTMTLIPSHPALHTTLASDVLEYTVCKVDLPEDYKISITQGVPFHFDLISSTGWTTTNTNGLGAFIRVRLDGVHTVAAVA